MPTQPAVLGSARLGNFRLGYSGTASAAAIRAARVSIILDGVEARTRVRVGSLTIHDALNDAPNTCNLTTDDTPAPSVAQSLRVTVNSDAPRLLFNGALQTTDLSYEGRPTQGVYRCVAIDDLAQLNRRLPFGTWTDVSATTVAQELLADFAPDFTGAGIEAGLPLVSINLDGSEGFASALAQLAKAIGGYFYVEDKDLHLFQTEATDAPDPIEVGYPFLNDPPITATLDTSQIRTRVYGKGHGLSVLDDVPVGATEIPLENAAAWFNASGGDAITLTQRLTYTGLSARYIPPLINQVVRTPSNTLAWSRVVWADALGLFVAVAAASTSTAVMTSPDGVTWTARVPGVFKAWQGLAWSPELHLLCAVAATGEIMTSSDGMVWTSRTSPAATQWTSVCWAGAPLNLFVAVGNTGTDRAMTSPDGITWTIRTVPAVNWQDVTYAPALGLVVASGMNVANAIMTTPDAITWTQRTIAVLNNTSGIAWAAALGLFVVVATGQVFTSPDGITWTARAAANANAWVRVVWIDELGAFIAVSDGAVVTDRRIMSSTDGITWEGHSTPTVGAWRSVAWAQPLHMIVVVGDSGASVMTSTVQQQEILTGIPASGPGSIVIPIDKGTLVHLFVERNDLAAQAYMAALEGGGSDGIYEHLISDERRGEASITALADVELQQFSMPIVTVRYATRDTKTKSGKTIVVNLVDPPISRTLTIQDVTISEIDTVPSGMAPRFEVVASSVRFSLEDLLRRMSAVLL